MFFIDLVWWLSFILNLVFHFDITFGTKHLLLFDVDRTERYSKKKDWYDMLTSLMQCWSITYRSRLNNSIILIRFSKRSFCQCLNNDIYVPLTISHWNWHKKKETSASFSCINLISMKAANVQSEGIAQKYSRRKRFPNCHYCVDLCLNCENETGIKFGNSFW